MLVESPQNKSKSPAHLARGVWTSAEAMIAQVPVLTWQEAKGLYPWWQVLGAQLSQPGPPLHICNRAAMISAKNPFLAHPYVSRADLIALLGSHNQHFLQSCPITANWTL